MYPISISPTPLFFGVAGGSSIIMSTRNKRSLAAAEAEIKEEKPRRLTRQTVKTEENKGKEKRGRGRRRRRGGGGFRCMSKLKDLVGLERPVAITLDLLPVKAQLCMPPKGITSEQGNALNDEVEHELERRKQRTL